MQYVQIDALVIVLLLVENVTQTVDRLQVVRITLHHLLQVRFSLASINQILEIGQKVLH